MTNNAGIREKSTAPLSDIVKTKVLQVSTLCFGAYLYFVVDYFLRFSSRMPGYGSLRPTILVFLAVSLLLFAQKDRLKGKADDPIFKSFIALLIWLVVSLPLVEWPGSVIRENAQPFVLAASFLIFTALIIDSEKRLRVFIGVFLSCQIFRILEPLYLNITTGYWGSRTHLGGGEFAERLGGAPADVINPNELGFVIVTAIPFIHYFFWHGRWYAKLLYISLLPLMLYALSLTLSRGAFLALLVIAWMIFKDSKHKLVLLIVGAMIAIAGWNSMNSLQQERYGSLLGGESAQAETAEGRVRGAINELKLGLNRPIFGHGIGTTPEAKVNVLGERKRASHNFFAELLIEIGIVGAIIFVVFLKRTYNRFTLNRQKLKILGLDQYHFYSRLNMAMIAVFWMYVVYSFNYWGLSQYYWYLFAGTAIAFGRILDSSLARNGFDNEPRTPGFASSGKNGMDSHFGAANR